MLKEAQDKLEKLVEEYNETNGYLQQATQKLGELRLEIAKQQGFVEGLDSKEKKGK